MKRALGALAAIAFATTAAYSAEITVSDSIDQDAIWTNDNVYTLSGFIFVEEGASLTIEPGTVIKAETGTGASASALIVTRGSRIYALGTPSEPIIFTSVEDPMDGSLPDDLGGLWGGVIILGNAPVNSNKSNVGGADDVIEEAIEGVPTAFGERIMFGGDDPHDNSGIFRYVQIRFGGSPLVNDSEINGLTMGGVGDGTVIEFVEVFANADDAFEWFGGTVNARYLVAAFQGDDAFDYDQGWGGKGQFWFAINNYDETNTRNPSFTPDNGGEHDGEENDQGKWIGGAKIANATYIGGGAGAAGSGIRIRDNGYAKYYNSIFGGFDNGSAVRIESSSASLVPSDPSNPGETEVDISHNIFFDFDRLAHDATSEYMFSTASLRNTSQNPMLRGMDRSLDPAGGLDPRPAANSPAFSNPRKSVEDPWFLPTSYQGAFGDYNWLRGWTFLDAAGYLPEAFEKDTTRIANVSVRTSLDSAEGEVVGVGIVISGDQPRMVLVRAEGAGLANNAVANPASSTAFQIIDAGTGQAREGGRIWTNWVDEPEAAALAAAGDCVGLEPLDNDETSGVALITLNPGAHVISVSNPEGTGGEALISATILDF